MLTVTVILTEAVDFGICMTAGSVRDLSPVDLGHLDGRKTHGVLSGTEFRQLGHVSACAAVLQDMH